MRRVASLFLLQLPIERLRRTAPPRARPEPRPAPELPVDDDPGACSVPRGGGWRPGARWAQGADAAHRQPLSRELGRRSEAAAHPFRTARADDGGRAGAAMPAVVATRGDRPFVLAIQDGQRQVVHAANGDALALGLVPGTPIAQAKALVAELEVAPADPVADMAVLERLAMHAVRHWTPTAAADAPDGLLLDLTGTTHLFGGELRFCRRLVRFLARIGITARIAIADTPGAAHALARFGGGPVLVVPPSGVIQAIASLPVAALRLDETALVAARRFGLERIGDLLPLPRGPLTRRLGRAAILRLDQAIGRVAEPLHGTTLVDCPLVERRLLEPIATPEAISQVMNDLAGDLAEILRIRGLGARALSLRLLRVDAQEQVIALGLARASRDAAHLARLLMLRVEQVEPGLGIEIMRLAAIRSDALSAEPLGRRLAGEDTSEDIAPLVDQLAGRVGHRGLFKAAPVESDVPERAVARTAPLDKPLGWPAWRRPARLLARPEPLFNVVALLPDHPPRRFGWRGELHDVVAGDGPERIYGEWWVRDGEIWAVRDYFCVEDSLGRRFWLFRRGDGVDTDTGDLSWWIHGAFG